VQNFINLKDEISTQAITSAFLDVFGISASTYSSTEEDWNQNPGKKLLQFKEEVGQEKFNNANKEFNKEFNTWLDKIILDRTYEKLSDDNKRKLIQDASDDIKNFIFKKYHFKPKNERKTPLPRELKYRKSS
jgi:hypothetical protein